jgi:putative tryptophan/tyrosine transport system substrate-binding protein
VRLRLPALYPFASYAKEGGLISYGVDPVNQFQQGAGYVDRMLRGAKPADLPVQYPTKFQLVVNLKTAKTLGLAIPESSCCASTRSLNRDAVCCSARVRNWPILLQKDF